MSKRTLFASISTRKLTGDLDGRETTIDFETVWHELLLPAVPEDWEAGRLDEFKQPGDLTRQAKELLEQADVVVFDITFSLPNLFFEMGVRHTTTTTRSVYVAHKGTELPFYVQNQAIYSYDFKDRASWPQFHKKLREAILSCADQPWTPEKKAAPAAGGLNLERLRQRMDVARNTPQLTGLWRDWQGVDEFPVEILRELGQKFFEAGRNDLAIEVLARAYEIAPDGNEIARTYGWFLRKDGQLEKAEPVLRHAHQLNPNDIDAMGMLGGLYKRQGQYEQAQEMYSQAVAVDSKSTYHLVNLGAIEAILNPEDLTTCRTHYQIIIDLWEPVYKKSERMEPWDRLSLAEAYLMTDRVDEARRLYLESVKDKGMTDSDLESPMEQLEIFKAFNVKREEVSEILHKVFYPKLKPAFLAVDDDELLPIIVHLSDVHFGTKPDQQTGNQIPMHRFKEDQWNRPLANHVIDAIRELQRGNANQPILIVISGDIAYQAMPNEYKDAKTFIDTVLQGTNLHYEHLLIVPGNHDVNWKMADVERARRYEQFLAFLLSVYGSKPEFHNLYPELSRYRFQIGEKPPQPWEILAIKKLPQWNLFLAGLNSCVFEDQDSHYGFVGKKQLQVVKQQLMDIADETVKIAVLHHHVIPVKELYEFQKGEVVMDRSIVRDFSLVEEQLHGLGFDIVLHGHKHVPSLRESSLRSVLVGDQNPKRLIICGAGSVSVADEELPQAVRNQFQILHFERRRREPRKPFLRLEWREYLHETAQQTWKARDWRIEG